jgi:hypothetical protein
MKNYRLSLCGVVLLVCLGQASTDACTCAQTQLSRHEIHSTAALFSGRCTKIEKVTDSHRAKVSFDVKSVWKGMLGKTVVIRTPASEAACGYTFRVGGDYMVYAYDRGRPGEPYTGLCTHTKPLAKAAIDKALFGSSLSPDQIGQLQKKIEGTGGLYVQGAPIPFRMVYRGGIDAWSAGVKRDLNGLPAFSGNGFLSIRKIKANTRELVPEKKEQKAVQAVAKEAGGSNKPFAVIVDLSKRPEFQEPGRYLVTWGCKLEGGFEIAHTSIIEVLDPSRLGKRGRREGEGEKATGKGGEK